MPTATVMRRELEMNGSAIWRLLALACLALLLSAVSFVGEARAEGDGCRDSRRCRRIGLCTELAGECVAKSEADCLASAFCESHGRCDLDPVEHRCVNRDEIERKAAKERERRSTRRHSTPMFIGGLVTVGIGGAAVVTGAFVALSTFCLFDCGGGGREERLVAAGITAGSGAGLALLVGLPITLVGARRVPASQEPLPAASWRFELRGTSAGLAVDF